MEKPKKQTEKLVTISFPVDAEWRNRVKKAAFERGVPMKEFIMSAVDSAVGEQK